MKLVHLLSIAMGGILFASSPAESPLPREALVQDIRQLVRLLEERHPDPYTAFGGTLEFHRKVDECVRGIPEGGLAFEPFRERLQAFLAVLRDGHTSLHYPINASPSPGFPVAFRVVGDSLVVSAVWQDSLLPLLGSRLRSLGPAKLEDLMVRQSTLRGHENPPGLLQGLAVSLSTAQGLRRLLPGWKPGLTLEGCFILPDGQACTVSLDLSAPRSRVPLLPPSRLRLPAYSKGALAWGFLDNDGKTAILRIRDCVGYRECLEWALRGNPDWATKEARRIFREDTGRDADGLEQLLAHLPSALETFAGLAREMKARGTQDLIVDLRGNSGGHARISDLLVYVLYGEAGLGRIRPGYSIARDPETGFYDFRSEQTYRANLPRAPRALGSMVETGSPLVDREIQERRLGGIYAPRVQVLTSARTYSAGYMIARDLAVNGARLIGTPSGQAGNAFMDPRLFRLRHTGIEGTITSRAIFDFPNDRRGHVLETDAPVTYERLKELHFDPNVEVLMALGLGETH